MNASRYAVRAKQLGRILPAVVVAIVLFASPASAQYTVPPDEGGEIKSMGQPPIWKPNMAVEMGGYYKGDANDFVGLFNAGILKDLINPVAGALAAQAEGYIGTRGNSLTGGFKGLLMVPFFSFGTGLDYNFDLDRLDFMFRIQAPIARGGLMGMGGSVQINWLPWRGQLTVGAQVPLLQPWVGQTRPRNTQEALPKEDPAEAAPVDDASLNAVLANVRESAHWVNRLTTPFTNQGGGNREKTLANFTAGMEEIRTFLTTPTQYFPEGPTSEGVVRFYHAELDRAFSIAVSGEALAVGESNPLGRSLAERYRDAILREIIYPYNRLLGVKKKNDYIPQASVRAQRAFEAWLREEAGLPAGRVDAVVYAAHTLLEIIEETRAYSRQAWGDPRLVWIPLQFALLPEQHDTQDELNAIIDELVGPNFAPGNQVWYVLNAQFQWELLKTVERAEEYHVLWIHDIAGRNALGDPDGIAYIQVLDGYLKTLTRRVREYDETGILPTYIIIQDQLYYESKNSRFWLSLLQDPLNHRIKFPKEFAFMQEAIQAQQAELREAVAGSERLQEEARQYGQGWLKNRVSVHVNITLPADQAFWSNSVFPFLAWPDNLMRDHRKLAFYDITEEDPYRGMAIFGGMGLAEHYVGPHWEDRAILIQGPGALEIKNKARDLFLSQGFKDDEIPYPLQPRPKAADYDLKVLAAIEAERTAANLVQLHNETGYMMKPLSVARTAIFSLMPAGSVNITPDSLWNSPYWFSLLLGQCLRGGRAFIINPSEKNAPGHAFMTLSVAHELFRRIVVAQDVLGEQIDRAGGVLRGGLYNVDVGVADLPGRVRVVLDGINANPWLRELLNFDPGVYTALEDAANDTTRIEYVFDDETGRTVEVHLKVNFHASAPAWELLLSQPAFADLTRAYLEQRKLDVQARAEYRDVRELRHEINSMGVGLEVLREAREEASREQIEGAMAFLLVGSSNMDYRSMLMDGEVGVLVAGRASLTALYDMIFFLGAATWIEDQETLDELLPPVTGVKWRLGETIKKAL